MFLFTFLIIASFLLSGFFDYLIIINLGVNYFWIGILLIVPTFYALFGIFVIFLTIWSLFLSDKYIPNKPNFAMYRLTRNIIYVLLRIFRIKIHVEGKNIINPKEKYLVVSNHLSMFDPMLLIMELNHKPLVCVSKPQNLQIFVGGKFIRYTGFIPVDRENPREAIKAISKACSVINNNYGNVYIAPEGQRNKSSSLLLPMHPGSFKIATETKSPILVTCVRKTREITQKFLFTSKNVFIDYLKVIPYEEYKNLSTVEIKDMVENILLTNLQEKGI